MKCWLLGLALVAAPALAQTSDSAPADSAMELVEALDMDGKLERMFTNLAPMFGTQAVAELSSNPQTRPVIEKIVTEGRGGRERLEAILTEEFLVEIRKTFPAVKAEIAAGFGEHLTQAELDELSRFFSSGVGAKYVALEPKLEGRLAEAGQRIGMKAGMAVFPRAMERVEAEMMR